MNYAFLGRISRPFSDISGLIIDWSKQCKQLWVYQHDADESVSRTHCHIFVIDSERDAEGLKKLVSWKSLKLKGNADSSFKQYKKIHDITTEGKWYNALKYASKGHLQPVYAHGDNANAIANESLAHWETADANANANANANVSSVSKPKRVTQYDISRLAQSAYMEQYTEEIMGKPYLEFNALKLGKIIASLLKANRMCAKYNIVAGIIQDIQCDLSPDRYWQKVLSMV